MSEQSVRGCHADRIFTITKEKKPKPRSAGLATAWGIGGVRKTLCARRQFLIGYFSVSMPPEEGAWLEAAGGRCYSIKGSSSLGRSAANTIVLESPKVSRRHALVHLQNIGEPWLIDFGSSNGTFLNQRRIHRPIRLSDGDEITIGDQILKFHQPVGISEEYKTDVVQRTLRNIDKIPCWLLVADIRGFTPLSQQMRSEDLDLFLGAWIFSCKEIIENQHGIINKYLGDGFLAYWPEASTRPEEIVAVISALKELQRNESPPFRLVAHFGPVATGGVASMGEESLIGGEVNLIFRLEKLAGSLGEPCCVSETANAKLHGLVATRSLGQFELKGFEGKCAFFAL